MPKYLWKVAYTKEGLAGVMRQGAASRADQIKQITEKNGGTLESFNFAFGETDVYVTAELPNDVTAAAIALAVASSGTASIETVKLLTPSEIDEARSMQTGYVPPGS